MVRARRVQRKGDDSVVKLRPVVPSDLPADLRADAASTSRSTPCPAGSSARGRSRATPPRAASGHVPSGDAPLRKMFSKEQRAFYAEHAPEGVALDDLTSLGPIFVLKLKCRAARTSARGSSPSCGCTRTARGSSSCRPGARPTEAFQVAAETRAFLTERGVELGGEQQTKTRTALEFFAKRTGGRSVRLRVGGPGARDVLGGRGRGLRLGPQERDGERERRDDERRADPERQVVAAP